MFTQSQIFVKFDTNYKKKNQIFLLLNNKKFLIYTAYTFIYQHFTIFHSFNPLLTNSKNLSCKKVVQKHYNDDLITLIDPPIKHEKIISDCKIDVL